LISLLHNELSHLMTLSVAVKVWDPLAYILCEPEYLVQLRQGCCHMVPRHNGRRNDTKVTYFPNTGLLNELQMHKEE